MSVIDIVTQLKTLCSNEENRPYIVRRGILPGLVGFLDNSDTQVVECAIECVEMLSSHKANGDLICREPFLLKNVWMLFNSEPTKKIKLISADVLFSLAEKMVEAYKAERPGYANYSELIEFLKSTGKYANADFSVFNKKTEVVSPVGEKKIVVFGVSNIGNAGVAQKLEKLLLDTNGVVSYTLDFKKRVARVFYRRNTAKLQRRIEEIGIGCTVKSEKFLGGTGLQTPAGKSTNTNQTKKNKSPQYASDEEEAPHEASVTVSNGDDSLAARLARRKKQKAQEKKSFWEKFKLW